MYIYIYIYIGLTLIPSPFQCRLTRPLVHTDVFRAHRRSPRQEPVERSKPYKHLSDSIDSFVLAHCMAPPLPFYVAQPCGEERDKIAPLTHSPLSEPPGSLTTPMCCIAHSLPCPRPFLLFPWLAQGGLFSVSIFFTTFSGRIDALSDNN